MEVQIAGPVDSGKARGCESYQGFGFNPSDDAPEARRGVCHFLHLYMSSSRLRCSRLRHEYMTLLACVKKICQAIRGICPCGSYRFLGGLGQAGMNAGTNWVVLFQSCE